MERKDIVINAVYLIGFVVTAVVGTDGTVYKIDEDDAWALGLSYDQAKLLNIDEGTDTTALRGYFPLKQEIHLLVDPLVDHKMTIEIDPQGVTVEGFIIQNPTIYVPIGGNETGPKSKVKKRYIDNDPNYTDGQFNLPPDEAREAFYSKFSAKTAAAWPDPVKDPPFTPIPVPFTQGISSDSQTRLGYAVLNVPISYIEQRRDSYTQQVASLRNRGTIKKGTGHAYESYTIMYHAHGPEEIRSSVQEVLEQISLTPFITAEGGPFDSLENLGDIPHHEIAVRNFSVATVPELPNSLMVEIQFDPFLWDYFVIPQSVIETFDGKQTFERFHLDDIICWPLFKIWAKTRERSRYHGKDMNGKFVLSFPAESAMGELDRVVSEFVPNQGPIDMNAIKSLKALAEDPKAIGWVSSKNVKLLDVNRDPRINYAVIKVGSQELWNALITLVDNYAGLISWDRISHTFLLDDDGNMIPQGIRVNETLIGPSRFKKDKPIPAPETDSELQGLLDYEKDDPIPSEVDNQSPWQSLAIVFRIAHGGNSAFITALEDILAGHQIVVDGAYRSYTSALEEVWSKIRSVDLELSVDNPDRPSRSDIIVQRIAGTRGHNLGVSSLHANSLPRHQYLGGMDATFTVEGVCFTRAAKQLLDRIKEEFDRRALMSPSEERKQLDQLAAQIEQVLGKKAKEKVEKKFSEKDLDAATETAQEKNLTAFLRVENEIFQLLGVDFVFPVSLTFSAVDGQPGVWRWTMALVEFDPAQKRQEQVNFLPTSWQNIGKIYSYGGEVEDSTVSNPIAARGYEYFSVLGSLRNIELYPDMSLPTKFEFMSWVEALRKRAIQEVAMSDDKKTPTAQINPRESITLTPYEDYISGLVWDYIIQNKTEIANWIPAAKYFENYTEMGGFVDPDFYCWFGTNGSWGDMFDTIAEGVFGKMNEDLSAVGRTLNDSASGESHLPPASGPRYRSTEVPVTATPGPEWYSGRARGGEHERLIQATKDNLFPKEQAEKAMEIAEKAENKFRKETPLFWDIAGSAGGNLDANVIDIAMPREDLGKVYLGEKSLDPMANAPIDDQGNRDLDIDHLPPGLDILIQSNWKQKFVSDMAQNGAANPAPIPTRGDGSNTILSTDSDQGFYIAIGSDKISWDRYKRTGTLPPEIQWLDTWLSESEKNDTRKPPGWLKELLENLGPIAQRKATHRNSGFISAGLRFLPILEKYMKDASIHSSFLERVFLANSSYSYYRAINPSELPTVPEDAENNTLGGDTHFRTNVMANVIDAYSSKAGVDPNLVRAFLITRTRMGIDRRGSRFLGGFSDIINTDLTVTQEINLIIKTLKDGLARTKGSPTLAMLYTHCLLTGKQQLWTKEKWAEFLSDLDAAGAQNEYDAAAVDVIQLVVKKYDDTAAGTMGGVMDLYFARYIECCRVYGTFLNSQMEAHKVGGNLLFDSLFHPLNPLIIYDYWRGNDFMRTRMTPTGAEVLIPFDRKIIHDDHAVFEIRGMGADDRDAEGSSAEIEAMRAKKLKVGLEPTSEDSIYGSLVDIRKYGAFGRLVGAFPSYLILIINEGFYWNGGNKKLWDQYYTRTGVSNISVFRSRYEPGATCEIVFSNMFHYLSSYILKEAMFHELSRSQTERMQDILNAPLAVEHLATLWNYIIAKNPDDEVRRIWQKNHVARLAITQGTRLHVRMGYGSNPENLPTVFNGNVVEAPIEDGYMTVIAAGDGAQLEKPCTTKLVQSANGFAFNNVGALGIGKDPSNIITEALVGGNLGANLTEGLFFRDWSGGITHFGDVYFDSPYHRPAEIQINIYSSNLTKIEQGISAVSNYFNASALYNYDDSNLFSVEVQEPTPWKVAEVCRRACMDFVASAEHFAFRSTLFFGKPWWPYHYTYHPSIVDFVGFTGGAYISDSATPNPEDQDSRQAQETISLPLVRVLGGLQLIAFPKDEDEVWVIKYSANDPTEPLALAQRIKGAMAKDTSTGEDIYISGFTKAGVERHLGAFYRDDMKSERYSPYMTREPEVYTLKQWLGTGGTIADEIKYRYTGESIVENNNYNTSETENRRGEGVVDLLLVNELVNHLKWKPLMQTYFAHSWINLLQNDLVADNSKMATDAIGTHLYNGYLSGDTVSRTISFCVDTDIHPADRKTMLVDTGILLTGIQAGERPMAEVVMGPAGFLVSRFLPFLPKDALSQTPTTPAIANAVVQALVDSVKEMYQGWITIDGMPSVKPRDLMNFYDHKTELKGPLFVKEVIHNLNADTGMITAFSPDAVVMPWSSEVGGRIVESLTMGFMQRLTAWMALKGVKASIVGIFRGKLERAARSRQVGDLVGFYKLLELENLGAIGDKNIEAVREALADFIKETEALSQEWSDEIDEVFPNLKPKEKKELIERMINQRRVKFFEKVMKENPEVLARLFGLEGEEGDLLRLIRTRLRPGGAEEFRAALEQLRLRLLTNLSESEVDEIIRRLEANMRVIVTDEKTLARFGRGWKGFIRYIGSTIDDSTRIVRLPAQLLAGGIGEFVTDLPKNVVKSFTIPWKTLKMVAKLPSSIRYGASWVKGALAGEKAEDIMRIRSQLSKLLKTAKWGFRVAGNAGPLKILSLLAEGSWYLVGGLVVEAFNYWLKSRQCVRILPLTTRGYPFTAGIRGHAGAVYGDDPSWVDNVINGWVSPADKDGNMNPLGVFLAILGVEEPDSMDEYDSAWKQYIDSRLQSGDDEEKQPTGSNQRE